MGCFCRCLGKRACGGPRRIKSTASHYVTEGALKKTGAVRFCDIINYDVCCQRETYRNQSSQLNMLQSCKYWLKLIKECTPLTTLSHGIICLPISSPTIAKKCCLILLMVSQSLSFKVHVLILMKVEFSLCLSPDIKYVWLHSRKNVIMINFAFNSPLFFKIHVRHRGLQQWWWTHSGLLFLPMLQKQPAALIQNDEELCVNTLNGHLKVKCVWQQVVCSFFGISVTGWILSLQRCKTACLCGMEFLVWP